MSHIVNMRSRISEAYPLAYLGDHLISLGFIFQKIIYQKKYFKKKGSALIFTSNGDIERFFGHLNHLTYNYAAPLVDEVAIDKFIYRGSFENSGDLIQKLVSRYCICFELLQTVSISI